MKQAKRSILTSVSGDSVRSEGMRRKRQEPKVRCWLNVTGDYKFFKEVTKMVNANDNAKMSVAASLLVGIIQGASTIFQKTDFNLDAAKTADNIQFGIRAMTIETQQPLSGPFKSEFIGVEAFLTLHSEIDSSSVYLSYRFTYRDFDGGVLGLAYVAQRGSCEEGVKGISLYKVVCVVCMSCDRKYVWYACHVTRNTCGNTCMCGFFVSVHDISSSCPTVFIPEKAQLLQ